MLSNRKSGTTPSYRDAVDENILSLDYRVGGEVGPETNTFHFPTGKATVTLHDVACIYGLPINSPAIIGTTFPNANVA